MVLNKGVFEPLEVFCKPLEMIHDQYEIVYHQYEMIYHQYGIVLQQFKDDTYSKPSEESTLTVKLYLKSF